MVKYWYCRPRCPPVLRIYNQSIIRFERGIGNAKLFGFKRGQIILLEILKRKDKQVQVFISLILRKMKSVCVRLEEG